jgi:hypothetical protein
MKNTSQDHAIWLRKQKGATLVEFAIILPVFVILIFGIIEFSLLLYNKGIITHAAREGARVGVVYNTGTDPDVNNRISVNEITGEVGSYIDNHLVSFALSIPGVDVDNIDDSDLDNCPNQSSSGQKLRVRVNYTYSFLVLPFTIPLSSEALMVCE